MTNTKRLTSCKYFSLQKKVKAYQERNKELVSHLPIYFEERNKLRKKEKNTRQNNFDDSIFSL
jgi:hypothetical protein